MIMKISKFFPVERKKVFTYWTHPELIEKWFAPKGLTLKVLLFEAKAKANGSYRYEYTGENGVYLCTGQFKEFIPNDKLVTVDSVKAPDGKLIFENLEATIIFKEVSDGTEVFVTQKGFPDEKSAKECQESWHECLGHLSYIISGNVKAKPRNDDRIERSDHF